ncbi:unnamed protein product [Schistosoma turkestanicum]|nr:unnamed protein product [Schistosoma turkestanicum]
MNRNIQRDMSVLSVSSTTELQSFVIVVQNKLQLVSFLELNSHNPVTPHNNTSVIGLYPVMNTTEYVECDSLSKSMRSE